MNDSAPRAHNSAFALHAQAARGAASNYAGQVVVLATAVLLTPVVLHSVGPASFALWVLANSLAGYGGLLDLGISSTVQKYVAEHRARGTTDEISALVSTAVTLYGALGLLAFTVFIALAPVMPSFLGVQGEDRGVAVWLIVLVGFQLAIALPAATPSAVIRGAQRYEFANLLVIGATLISAALTVLVLALGGGIVAVAAVGVVVAALMLVPAVWLARRAAPELRFDASAVTRRRARALFSFSASIFAVRLAGVLKTRTDPLVIGAALPVRLITPFALAQRLPEAASLLTNQFVQVLLPLASELDARQERRALQTVYLASTRVALALSLAFGATIGVLGSSILRAWVGDDYSGYGHLVAILAVAAVVETLGWPAATILTGMGRHRPLAWMALSSGAAKIALSVILIFPFGLTGVAVATLIPAAVQTLILVLPYSLRTMGLGASHFAAQVIFPNVLPAAATVSVLVAARTLVNTDRTAILVGACVVALTVYAVAYLRFSASVVERQFYRQLGTTSWSLLTRAARD